MFSNGKIIEVEIKPIKKYIDERGYLAELFRQDEIDTDILPLMSYISMTLPGIIRGPHEHVEQTDYFCFMGPSNFKLILWDNREDSSTYNNRMELFVGEDNPTIVIVPWGVVHAYKNIGNKNGIVYNFPNKLFAGEKKKFAIDEIRYEMDTTNPFPFV